MNLEGALRHGDIKPENCEQLHACAIIILFTYVSLVVLLADSEQTQLKLADMGAMKHCPPGELVEVFQGVSGQMDT